MLGSHNHAMVPIPQTVNVPIPLTWILLYPNPTQRSAHMRHKPLELFIGNFHRVPFPVFSLFLEREEPLPSPQPTVKPRAVRRVINWIGKVRTLGQEILDVFLGQSP